MYFFLTITVLVHGQEGSNVDLDHIYNKWVYSDFDSYDGVLVYRNEAFFETVLDLGAKPKRWRFATHSNVFINAPYRKPRPQSLRWCGNDKRPVSYRKRLLKPSRVVGEWELKDENGKILLVLHYYRGIKGEAFELERSVTYQIIHLEKNLMELTIIDRVNVL